MKRSDHASEEVYCEAGKKAKIYQNYIKGSWLAKINSWYTLKQQVCSGMSQENQKMANKLD